MQLVPTTTAVGIVAIRVPDNLNDEVGNVHLDVQLEDIDKRVELNINNTALDGHASDKDNLMACQRCPRVWDVFHLHPS